MRLFLSLRSDRNLMQWRQAFLLAKFLTMSLLCCFSLRDYGSKRKSGKSPVLFDFLFPHTSSTLHFPQLIACHQTACLIQGSCFGARHMTQCCCQCGFYLPSIKKASNLRKILKVADVRNVKIEKWRVCLLKWKCLSSICLCWASVGVLEITFFWHL